MIKAIIKLSKIHINISITLKYKQTDSLLSILELAKSVNTRGGGGMYIERLAKSALVQTSRKPIEKMRDLEIEFKHSQSPIFSKPIERNN